MSRVLIEEIVGVARAARAAGHGGKGAIYDAACARLGISRASLHNYLKEYTMSDQRKRRSDAGASSLTLDEAKMISAYIREGKRANGKGIVRLKDAVAQLRANGAIRAEWLDEATGEVAPLSDSAIARALKGYGLHPDQVDLMPAATPLRSDHPNHVWQIDASLCVLYKMPTKVGNRLEEIDDAEYYKNKMHNWHKVEHLLVQRYLVTDHTSGVEWPEYRLGGESVANLLDVLIAVTQERAGFPFYGRPRILQLDPGSANTAGPLKNLCKHLGTEIYVTKRKNPRSKGQVEGGHNRNETGFESGLNKLVQPIDTIDKLNTLAHKWAHWMNGTKVHTRHGLTRYAAWQRISASQLVICPAPEVMRILSHEEPEERVVNDYLRIQFGGQVYSVRDLPGVQNGGKVAVARNAWSVDSVWIAYRNEEGRERLFEAPVVEKDGWGFGSDAQTIGEGYHAQKDTPAVRATKELELIATGADTLEEAAERRKKGVVPFQGAINPYKQAEEYTPPAWLPKKGTALETDAVVVERPPVGIVPALERIRALAGDAWDVTAAKWIRQRYPDGVPEDQIEVLARRLVEAGSVEEAEAPRVAVGGGLRVVK